MKVTLAVVAGAAVAVAQNSSLPECGQTCINNMIGIVQMSPYNCPSGNAACYCCFSEFGFGVHDCATQNCGSDSAAATSAIVYAASYCASALPTSSVCSSYTTGVAAASGATTSGASGAGATSGASAGTQFIVPVASGSSGYSIDSTTITAGGPEVTESGTAYSALASNGGVVAMGSSATTTYEASALNALAGATSGAGAGSQFIVPVASGSSGYSIDSTTITAGGPEVTESGTAYSALASNAGVVAMGSSVTTTYDASALNALNSAASSGAAMTSPATQSGNSTTSGTGAGAGGASGSSTTSHSGSSASSSSSSSAGGAAMITAAPALFGAAALAVLAL